LLNSRVRYEIIAAEQRKTNDLSTTSASRVTS